MDIRTGVGPCRVKFPSIWYWHLRVKMHHIISYSWLLSVSLVRILIQMTYFSVLKIGHRFYGGVTVPTTNVCSQ